MTRKTAYSKVHNQEITESKPKNFWDYAEIHEKVEVQIKSFLDREVVLCHRAKQEGWLGSEWNCRDYRGLLGYLRTSYARQIQILMKLDNPLPLYQTEFVTFFRSDFFENVVLEKGHISLVYKKEHFEIIKKYKL